MSAPFSTTSLANSLNLRVSTHSTRNAVLGIDGIGASSDSFSRTLQNQMNAGGSARSEAAPNPVAREPERSRAPEPTREPERPAEPNATSDKANDAQGKRTDADAGTSRSGGEARSDEAVAPGNKGETTRGKETAGKDGQAADAGEAATAETGTVGEESADTLAALAKAGTQAEGDLAAEALAVNATATPPTDPAALAGLPAAIAALLSGRQAPPDSEAAPDAPLLAADGKGGSLQNSGLLPKTDVSADAGGRGVATPAFLLQGRELAAAVISTRGAASGQAVQSLQGEPGSASSQQGAQGLLAHGAMHVLRHAPATQAATPQLPVHTPAGQQAWAEDVGNQVRWMLGRAESKAELVLTPPNLGKLEVSINLNGDQTTAQFVASSQAARDALERAMPQLREVLQQAGIMLGDANVSTSQQGSGGEGQEGRGRSGARGEAAIAGEASGTGSNAGVWLRQQQGMVDTFA